MFTAHDVDPVFGDRASYHRKLRLLVEWRVPFVCLTAGSAEVLRRRLGAALVSTVVPHGYVVSPDTLPAPGPYPTSAISIRYLLFGALRDNRDVPTVLYNWRLGELQRSSTLSMLLRAPGRTNLAHERETWELVASTAATDPRLRVAVVPYRAVTLGGWWASHGWVVGSPPPAIPGGPHVNTHHALPRRRLDRRPTAPAA